MNPERNYTPTRDQLTPAHLRAWGRLATEGPHAGHKFYALGGQFPSSDHEAALAKMQESTQKFVRESQSAYSEATYDDKTGEYKLKVPGAEWTKEGQDRRRAHEKRLKQVEKRLKAAAGSGDKRQMQQLKKERADLLNELKSNAIMQLGVTVEDPTKVRRLARDTAAEVHPTGNPRLVSYEENENTVLEYKDVKERIRRVLSGETPRAGDKARKAAKSVRERRKTMEIEDLNREDILIAFAGAVAVGGISDISVVLGSYNSRLKYPTRVYAARFAHAGYETFKDAASVQSAKVKQGTKLVQNSNGVITSRYLASSVDRTDHNGPSERSTMGSKLLYRMTHGRPPEDLTMGAQAYYKIFKEIERLLNIKEVEKKVKPEKEPRGPRRSRMGEWLDKQFAHGRKYVWNRRSFNNAVKRYEGYYEDGEESARHQYGLAMGGLQEERRSLQHQLEMWESQSKRHSDVTGKIDETKEAIDALTLRIDELASNAPPRQGDPDYLERIEGWRSYYLAEGKRISSVRLDMDAQRGTIKELRDRLGSDYAPLETLNRQIANLEEEINFGNTDPGRRRELVRDRQDVIDRISRLQPVYDAERRLTQLEQSIRGAAYPLPSRGGPDYTGRSLEEERDGLRDLVARRDSLRDIMDPDNPRPDEVETLQHYDNVIIDMMARMTVRSEQNIDTLRQQVARSRREHRASRPMTRRERREIRNLQRELSGIPAITDAELQDERYMPYSGDNVLQTLTPEELARRSQIERRREIQERILDIQNGANIRPARREQIIRDIVRAQTAIQDMESQINNGYISTMRHDDRVRMYDDLEEAYPHQQLRRNEIHAAQRSSSVRPNATSRPDRGLQLLELQRDREELARQTNLSEAERTNRVNEIDLQEWALKQLIPPNNTDEIVARMQEKIRAIEGSQSRPSLTRRVFGRLRGRNNRSGQPATRRRRGSKELQNLRRLVDYAQSRETSMNPFAASYQPRAEQTVGLSEVEDRVVQRFRASVPNVPLSDPVWRPRGSTPRASVTESIRSIPSFDRASTDNLRLAAWFYGADGPIAMAEDRQVANPKTREQMLEDRKVMMGLLDRIYQRNISRDEVIKILTDWFAPRDRNRFNPAGPLAERLSRRRRRDLIARMDSLRLSTSTEDKERYAAARFDPYRYIY